MHFKRVFLVFFLLAVCLLAAQNFEGFETGNFLEYKWQFSGDMNWDTTFYSPYEGVYCAQSGEITASQYSRISITMETVETGNISFYWKVDSEENADFFIFYLDGEEQSSISGQLDWQLVTVNIEPGTHTFRWSYEKDEETNVGQDAGWLDSITFPVTTTGDIDLALKYIQGSSTVYQGFSSVYNVRVKNYGTTTQDNFVLSLYRQGGTLLDQLTVTDPLETEEEKVYHLVWIVPNDEPAANTYVYAELTLTGDEHPENNITSSINVTIYDFGLVPVQVGDGDDETNWYPFKFHMNASLAETIYRANAIGETGTINAIGYDYVFVEDIEDAPVQVYMGTTSMTSLTNNWISGSSLTLVYEGTLNFYSGTNHIIIPLDTPVVYNGSNLCILTHHQYMDDTFNNNNKFIETTNTTYYDCTRAVGSTGSLNATSPTGGYIFSRYPNLTIYFANDYGTLEGNVYDSAGNSLPGTEISVGFNTMTNGSGFYQFGNLTAGNYTVTATKAGYQEASIQASVNIDQTTIVDFNLTGLPTVEITGNVTGSEFPTTGMVNAVVSLLGTADYQCQTDNNGDFVFPEVYGNANYTLNISHSGYQNFITQLQVGTEDIDLGTLLMSELALPPTNVVATQDSTGSELTLTWTAPEAIDREFETCTIYRFLEANNGSPSIWDVLEVAYTDTIYIDPEWNTLYTETFQYAVEANYTNGIVSEATLSNAVERIMVGNDQPQPLPKNQIRSIYPNPFNPSTTISFKINNDQNEQVRIVVYNLKGQKVRQLVNDRLSAGVHSITWNGRDENDSAVASGLYLIKMNTDSQKTDVKKCLLLK
ncbi:MAG TPA: carboxypeptidase regulatory-like domain-containing protein [Candidatus Cloacimonadota bacterium]|nr:carboxypeptidase regulatory-like domain-containing protein [Candidatus Cloacimonadota bacterium]